ncbi:MAG: hypothetical protein ACJAT7_000583 [Psychromonas sp.]|jgi:hypothetical protein|uniref:hypothetical protein n=1 Tax=Psychromonas sp. TaxID=1884585 RepID=UPI0039E57FFF
MNKRTSLLLLPLFSDEISTDTHSAARLTFMNKRTSLLLLPLFSDEVSTDTHSAARLTFYE